MCRRRWGRCFVERGPWLCRAAVSLPCFKPLPELTGPQAVTGHIAFVKMEQLRFHDLNETGAMQRLHLLNNLLNVPHSLFLVHFLAHHMGDNFGNLFPELQTERVRIAQGLRNVDK
jgi:hypothetical protein